MANDFQPCPSCGHALQRVEGESTPGNRVFSCPVESLRYLSRPDAGLQPYTRGPFVAALYSLIFSSDPVSEAEGLAQRLLNEESADDILFMILACEAELENPSCRLETLYDYANDLSEHQLRDFLRQYARRLRELR